MLGNQLFLARNYFRAAEHLEQALYRKKDDKYIRRKLIICYTQIGNIHKALEHFLTLIKEDIQFIVKTDPVADDCPCPELVLKMEGELNGNPDSFDYHVVLGMLYLYCDAKKSFHYFQRAYQIDQSNSMISSILIIIKKFLNSLNKTTAHQLNAGGIL